MLYNVIINLKHQNKKKGEHMKDHDDKKNGWEKCHVVIRCLWDGQEITGDLGYAETFYHRVPRIKHV
jgi:hypothetical protein